MRYLLEASPTESVVAMLKKRVIVNGLPSEPVVGLGNEEEVLYYLENINTTTAWSLYRNG